jgi:hypothetical protein
VRSVKVECLSNACLNLNGSRSGKLVEQSADPIPRAFITPNAITRGRQRIPNTEELPKSRGPLIECRRGSAVFSSITTGGPHKFLAIRDQSVGGGDFNKPRMGGSQRQRHALSTSRARLTASERTQKVRAMSGDAESASAGAAFRPISRNCGAKSGPHAAIAGTGRSAQQ